MTPKEKAKDILKNYMFVYSTNNTSIDKVKEASLICVNEVIGVYFKPIDNRTPFIKIGIETEQSKFWMEVKKELELL